MSTDSGVGGDFEAVLDRIRSLCEKIGTKIEWFRQKIDSLLSEVPDMLSWVVDRVREGWNLLVGKLAELWDWIDEKLAYAGSPHALGAAADRWRMQVGHPADAAATRVTDGALQVDDCWQGPAADQYRQRVAEQRETLAAIRSDFANPIADALDDVAWAIYAFWTGIGGALVGLVATIVGAAGTIPTVVGIPAGTGMVIAGILTFLGSAGAATYALTEKAGGAARTLETVTSSGLDTWPRFAS